MDQIAPLLAPGGLVAALLGVAMYAVRVLVPSLARARMTRAEAALVEAQARRERAVAETAETQRDVMRDEMLAGMLAGYEARLARIETDAREARAAVDECERRHRALALAHAQEVADLRRQIAALERAVRRLGGTPTGLHAVLATSAGEET